MKVWVRINTHIHEGIGPGFPDTRVVDSVDVFEHPMPNTVECETQNLKGQVTEETKILRG